MWTLKKNIRSIDFVAKNSTIRLVKEISRNERLVDSSIDSISSFHTNPMFKHTSPELRIIQIDNYLHFIQLHHNTRSQDDSSKKFLNFSKLKQNGRPSIEHPSVPSNNEKKFKTSNAMLSFLWFSNSSMVYMRRTKKKKVKHTLIQRICLNGRCICFIEPIFSLHFGEPCARLSHRTPHSMWTTNVKAKVADSVDGRVV